MYYKLIDKKCEKYKKLYEMRKNEMRIEKENEAAILKRFPDWNGTFIGRKGRKTFLRVSTYSGLAFNNPDRLDAKEWKEHKDHPGVYIPNRRTKSGREIRAFLLYGLQGGSFFEFCDIVGVDIIGSFTFPYMGIGPDEALFFYFDDRFGPLGDFIEITQGEFEKSMNDTHK